MDDYDLGNNYYYGNNNYKQDTPKAIQHLIMAAEKKDVRAMYLLGHIYMNDNQYDLARDQLLFFVCSPQEKIRIYSQQQIGDVYAKLGLIFDSDDRKQEAIDFYIRAQALNIILNEEINTRINEYYVLLNQKIDDARNLIESEKYNEAKQLLTTPIEKYPYHHKLQLEYNYYFSCISNKLHSYEKSLIDAILQSEHPDEFICPISWQIFREPVICNDGHTYERKELEKWFEQNKYKPKIFSPKEPDTEIFFCSMISNKNLMHAIIRHIDNLATELTANKRKSPKLAFIV